MTIVVGALAVFGFISLVMLIASAAIEYYKAHKAKKEFEKYNLNSEHFNELFRNIMNEALKKDEDSKKKE